MWRDLLPDVVIGILNHILRNGDNDRQLFSMDLLILPHRFGSLFETGITVSRASVIEISRRQGLQYRLHPHTAVHVWQSPTLRQDNRLRGGPIDKVARIFIFN